MMRRGDSNAVDDTVLGPFGYAVDII